MNTRLPTATPRETITTLNQLIRTRKALTAGAVTVLVTGTAAGLLAAPLVGHIVDLITARQPAGSLTWPVLAIVGVGIVQGVLSAAGLGLIARLGEGMLATLREQFVDRALHLPMDQVERAGSGDLTARVTGDVRVVADAVREGVPELARAVLTIGLTLVGLTVLDWRFLVAALLAAPIQILTVRWYGRHAAPLYARQRIAAGARQHQLLDTVGGASTVRAFRLHAPHVSKVDSRSRAALDLAVQAIRLQTGFYSRLNLAEFVGLAAVLATGFWLYDSGVVSLGTASAAALYFHNLFNPINAALGLVDDAQAAAAGLARLVGVAQLPATAAPPAARTGDSTVKVSGADYAYLPGHPVLSAVDLYISPGEKVALVGSSGAGKSTLAKLVAGVHPATGGEVTTGDGATLVTQEVHVFAGPLADDLRLAAPAATDAQVLAALDQVGAREWALALPDALQTVVGGGGHPLTATQAQQLALARLALADPAVAVLDEATAEAGSAGARLLEVAADRVLAGRTALVVAHRLTQAAAADRIVVLHAGRVAECGTHDELVAADGAYAELWRTWSGQRDTTEP